MDEQQDIQLFHSSWVFSDKDTERELVGTGGPIWIQWFTFTV